MARARIEDPITCECGKKWEPDHCPNCHMNGYVCVNMTFRKCIWCFYSLGDPTVGNPRG